MQDAAAPTKAAPPPSRAFAALIAGNAALAFGPWLVRLADTGPLAAGFWRLALALPFLALGVLLARQTLPPLGRRAWGVIALAGLFFAADLAAWHSGILHTRLANATLFGNVASFTFPLYGFLAARRWPAREQAIALGLAALGVVLLVGRSYDLSPRYLMGDLLCIAAGLFYTGYLAGIDRLRGRLGAWPLLMLSTLCGAPLLLAFAAARGEAILPQDWTPLMLLALGSQVVGQGCLVYAIGRLSPLMVGLGLLTQPVIAAAIGWVAYAERIGWVDAAGALLIGVALILVRRAPPPAPAAGA